MARIVINKHYNDSSLITPDKFKDAGEIIISNEYGFEGIYIVNTNGDVIRLGYGGGSSESGSTSGSTPSGDYVDKTFLRDYLKAQAYMTSSQTASYVSAIERGLAELSSGFTAHQAENIADFTELNERIDALSGITAEVVTDEHIRELASEEIAKIVDSADTRFDTLKEIADWIINDSTGAAELGNDVQELKNKVSGLTQDVEDLEQSMRVLNNVVLSDSDKISAISAATSANEERLNEVEEGLGELSSTTETLKDFVENYSADTTTFEALKAYVDEQIRNISRNGDHVFLSKAEYTELVTNGRAVISGETYYYSDYIYYCIYDDGNEYSGSTGGSIVYVLSGDMITFENIELTDDGFVVINGEVTDNGFIDLDAATTPIVDEEIVVDENDNISANGAELVTINGEDFVDLSNFNITPA